MLLQIVVVKDIEKERKRRYGTSDRHTRQCIDPGTWRIYYDTV